MPARLAAAVVLVIGASALGLHGGRGPTAVSAAPACPVAAHHAEIVVEHASGATLSACVGFAGSSISGEEVVRQSGIEYDMEAFGGNGEAVCQLDDEPQPVPPDCFGSGAYWELFVSRGCGDWKPSRVGVSSLQLYDGDLEGFHYVSSDSSPPGPAGYCPPVAPPPTAVPTRPAPPPATSRASATPMVAGGVLGSAATAGPTPSEPHPSAVATAPVADAGGTGAAPEPTAAVALAGPLQRSGEAPRPAPASGSPAWAYALGGAVLVLLAGMLARRLQRRRA